MQTQPTITAPTPPDLAVLLPSLPPAVTRKDGADLLRRHAGFPVSPRSLERWGLPSRRVNGKTLLSTAALFAIATQKMAEAPVIAGYGQKVAA